jgi:hypothetical protein
MPNIGFAAAADKPIPIRSVAILFTSPEEICQRPLSQNSDFLDEFNKTAAFKVHRSVGKKSPQAGVGRKASFPGHFTSEEAKV